jgi:FkbM family methyltransferase
MALGNRSITKIVGAPFRRQHWRAATNMFRVYDDVVDAYSRYLLGGGAYPTSIYLRTPLGKISPTIYSWHDMMTVNEIFCRHDYDASECDQTIVDFGSNIGISALYFLTRNNKSFAYCYEPLPINCERFERNLEKFKGRYQLVEGAVWAMDDGAAQFGYEPTGRYGGVGRDTGSTIRVECRNAINVLSRILDAHGEIDLWKIDTETLERDILLSVPEMLLAKIKKIYIEQQFENNPLHETHSFRQYGPIAQFFRSRTSVQRRNDGPQKK